MGQQQLLLVIVGVIIVGIAIGVGISLVQAQSVATSRDSMINDLNHLAAYAFQYRTRLASMGGGQGEYTGFTIPLRMRENEDASYSVSNIQPTNLTLTGTSAENSSNSITVTVLSDGKLQNWSYTGDYE